MTSILWRRLDAPGHDACCLIRSASGWRLEGAAVFREGDKPACIVYEVECDVEWRALSAQVRGRLGAIPVNFSIARAGAKGWRLNGEIAPVPADCIDVDFGFTPATNLLQLRRSDLALGKSADVPVAWLDVSTGKLERLEQRYERRGERSYWYEASRFAYAANLEVSADGFILRYPGLWEAELEQR